MAKDDAAARPHGEASITDTEDTHSLLSGRSSDNDEPTIGKARRSKRQSSLAQTRKDGLPRTVNRVRFEVGDDEAASRQLPERAEDWVDEEDYWAQDVSDSLDAGDRTSQRLPLLTNIEAPSVALAGDGGALSSQMQLEGAGPKSGMRSAFMNMANSIM